MSDCGRASWRARSIIAGLTACGLWACAEAVVAPAVVTEVTVNGAPSTLRVGQSGQLTALLRGDGGVTLPSTGVRWSSSDTRVVTADDLGRITALQRGRATVTAFVGTVSSATTVQVLGVRSVQIAPDSITVIVTQSAPMVATVDADTGVVVAPSWTSRDTTVATVSTTGRVTAASSPGSTWVVATAEDQRDSVRIVVVPVPVVRVTIAPDTATRIAGQSVQLVATPRDSIGGALAGRVISWSVSDSSRALVSATGLVTTRAAGIITVTATSGGKSGTATLTILPPVARVVMSTDTLAVIVTQTRGVTATPQAADGSALLDRALSWTVLDTSVARVSATGQVTGRTVGVTTVSATAEGKIGTAVIRVVPVPVAQVRIAPTSANVVVGSTQLFTAVTEDSTGAAITGRAITWSVSDTARATIATSGVLSARMAGTVTVTALSEGRSGTASVQLLPAAAVVRASLDSLNLIIGQTATLAATATASDGTGIDRALTWRSLADSIAGIDATGRVSARRVGRTGIVVALDGVADTVPVHVVPVPVAQVVISPATIAIVAGTSTGLTASLSDSTGALLSGRVVTWGVVDTAIARVDSTGRLTALRPGSTTVRATADGITGTAALTVLVPAATVTVAPSEVRLLVGGSARLTAAVRDSAARIIDRSVEWISTATSAVTVTAEGVVSAVGNGSATVTALVDGVRGSATVRAAGGSGGGRGTLVASLQTAPNTIALLAGDSTELPVRVRDAAGNAADLAGAGGVLIAGTLERGAGWMTPGFARCPVPGHCLLPLRADSLTATSAASSLVRVVPTDGVGEDTLPLIVYRDRIDSLAVRLTPTPVVTRPSLALGDSVDLEALVFAGSLGGVASAATFELGGAAATLRPCTVSWAGTTAIPGCVRVIPTAAGIVSVTAVVRGTGGVEWRRTMELDAGVVRASALQVSPTSVTVPAGQSEWLTATLLDEFSRPITGAAVTWRSADRAIALVVDGVVTGRAEGTTRITVEGMSRVAEVDVTVVTPFELRGHGLAVGGDLSTGGHSCAVGRDGSASCWGDNSIGQIGDGTQTLRSSPTAVAGGRSFSQVVAGLQHSCGLTDDGVAFCWGSNSRGQLGGLPWAPGTNTTESTVPIPVVDDHRFLSLASGSQFVCGLRRDQVVLCWGYNWNGQLGNGESRTSRDTPSVIPGLRFRSIVALEQSACGIATDGRTYCWGAGTSGVLGSGTYGDVSVPTPIAGEWAFTELAGAYRTICGRSAAGAIACWGENGAGQYASDRLTRAIPFATTTGIGAMRSVSLGADHACGIGTDGAARCWGTNTLGTLGDGTTTTSIAPVTVLLPATASRVVAGARHSCAVLVDGRSLCWGENFIGQLGRDSTSSDAVPRAIAGGRTFTSLTSGYAHSCGLVAGLPYCWGKNDGFQVDASGQDRGIPTLAAGGLLTFTSISAGRDFTCGLRADGSAWCWGQGWEGQFGSGSQARSATPQRVAAEEPFVSIAAGGVHACAIGQSGTTWCWGTNRNGEVGDSTVENIRLTPVRVRTTERFTSLALGEYHSCALTTDGRAFCWGAGSSRQLGDGTDTQNGSAFPVPVTGGLRYTQLSAKFSTTCALSSDGQSYCWGYNALGQVGMGSRSQVLGPTAAATSERFTSIGVGPYQTCAVSTSSRLFCWGATTLPTYPSAVGWNSFSTNPVDLVPRALPSPATYGSVRVGNDFACALTDVGVAQCWGWARNLRIAEVPSLPRAVSGGGLFRGTR